MSVEKANRTWHAGKPKKKPDYDREEITEELLAAVVGVYEALDEYGNHPSLQAIVDELDCGLNPLKVRKLLITAGEVQGKKIYESATVDEVLSLWKEGKSVEEIMSTLERSRASVNSYLPYTKIIYKMKESSVGADREKLYRERKKAVAEMAEEPSADNLWNAIVAFQGYPFKTSKGLSFTYKVKGGELFFYPEGKEYHEIHSGYCFSEGTGAGREGDWTEETGRVRRIVSVSSVCAAWGDK